MIDATIPPPGPLLAVLPPIDELVPHRPPMLLLDRVRSTDGQNIVCELTIRDGASFVERGAVAATVAIEYMAQAAAAWLGALARARGEPPGGGILVGLRDVVLHVDAFARGELLEIHARHTWGTERFMSFDCRVVIASRDVATATLNVLRNEP
jgi:predicted hotdog family 3-hydroxylacyl-ACP dehydratase